MENRGEIYLFGQIIYPHGQERKGRDDDYERNEPSDALSGDEQGTNEQPTKKSLHMHTLLQIQELEAFFKNCPYPDVNQRMELGRRLGMDKKQIKFWFQNRRTQMKTQSERQENILLKQENNELQSENIVIKDAMRNSVCNACGGPVLSSDLVYEEHQLKLENAKLKDDLERIKSMAHGVIGMPNNALANQGDGFGMSSSAGIKLPMRLNLGDGR